MVTRKYLECQHECPICMKIFVENCIPIDFGEKKFKSSTASHPFQSNDFFVVANSFDNLRTKKNLSFTHGANRLLPMAKHKARKNACGNRFDSIARWTAKQNCVCAVFSFGEMQIVASTQHTRRVYLNHGKWRLLQDNKKSNGNRQRKKHNQIDSIFAPRNYWIYLRLSSSCVCFWFYIERSFRACH